MDPRVFKYNLLFVCFLNRNKGNEQPSGEITVLSARRDLERLARARDDLHPPLERVVALGAEEVHVRLELQLEHKLLADVVALLWLRHAVAQQRQTRQRRLVLTTK